MHAVNARFAALSADSHPPASAAGLLQSHPPTSAAGLRRSHLPPASAAAGLQLNDWGDDALVAIFVRVPFSSHGAVRVVSKRLRELLSSELFRDERIRSGYAESGVILVGGHLLSMMRDGVTLVGGEMISMRRENKLSESWLWAKGVWRPIAARSASGYPVCAGPQREVLQRPGARSDASSVILNGEMWVFGGCEANSTEIYNPAVNRWRRGPDTCRAPGRGAAGVVAGKIVLAGGTDLPRPPSPAWPPIAPAGPGTREAPLDSSRTRFHSADAYSPETGWTPLPCVPDDGKGGSSATGCVLDGKLFLSTGRSLVVWDGKSWIARANAPDEKSGAASVAYMGKLWLIGGTDHREAPSNDVFIYDPASNCWETGPALPDRPEGQQGMPCFSSEVAVEYEGAIIYIGDRRALRLEGGMWSEQPMPPTPVIDQHSIGRSRRCGQREKKLVGPCLQAVFFG